MNDEYLERIWNIEEDIFLRSLVFQYACLRIRDLWGYIGAFLNRKGQDCRERWFYLNHNGPFNSAGRLMVVEWNGMKYCGMCHPDYGLPCPDCSYALMVYSSIEKEYLR